MRSVSYTTCERSVHIDVLWQKHESVQDAWQTMKVLGTIAVLLVGLSPALGGTGQSTICPGSSWVALQPGDPEYADALDLARTLVVHGFVVQCIAPSTMTGTFEGQVGAAVYNTNHGAFDALFLPKTESFDRLEIIERQQSARFLYSFAGQPAPWPTNRIDAADRVYFIKNLNRLLVAHDERLATRLVSALRR